MTDYAEVSPVDTTTIWTVDTNAVKYTDGSTNLVLNYDGRPVSRLTAPVPEWNIYRIEPDTRPIDAYYVRAPSTYAFVGAVGDSAAYVQETRNQEQIPIDDLYLRKQGELSDYVQQVTYSAIDAGDPTWAWVLDASQRLKITDVNEFLQDRLKDITIDSVVKPYWPDGYATNIVIQHKEFGSKKLQEVTGDTGAKGWGSLMKKKGQHGEAVANAAWLVEQDLDAAYDANGGTGWQALADIDVQDPAYGWPPWWPVS